MAGAMNCEVAMFVTQECPRRVLHKSVKQECPTRVLRVLHKSLPFGFVGPILCVCIFVRSQCFRR